MNTVDVFHVCSMIYFKNLLEYWKRTICFMAAQSWPEGNDAFVLNLTVFS